MYGDVQRVKILYNKKDSALIQMAEAHQAHLGKTRENIIKLQFKEFIIRIRIRNYTGNIGSTSL